MPYDPQHHHRRSIRLRGYDYTQPGFYFVTMCTYKRAQLFDHPDLKQIAEQQWQALAHAGTRGDDPGRVSVDSWVVMPDHVHGIIVLGQRDDGDVSVDTNDHVGFVGGQQPDVHNDENHILAAAPLQRWQHCDSVDHRIEHGGVRMHVAPGSLGAVVRSYKAAVARRVNRYYCSPGVPVWQRDYYERIVRDHSELHAVRRYIADNPLRHRDRLDALLARMRRKEQ